VVSDRRVPHSSSGVINYYTADIVSSNDYYPFGMAMVGRTFSSDGYRYGFNGMEKDEEFTNSASHYDFGARIYDSRLGRWLSLDPMMLKFPEQSPYNYVYNDVIRKKDIDGKYGSDGHFWTVYAMGLSMGLDNKTAYALAVESEHYDNLVHGNKLNNITFKTNMSGSVLGIPVPTWADGDLQGKYHGLNGRLSSKVKRDAIIGIMGGNLKDFHLYGDAFAHAKASSGYKIMYGICQGCFTRQHTFNTENDEGKDADDISKNSDQYLRYVKGLTSIIKSLYNTTKSPNFKLFNVIAKSGMNESERTAVFKSYIATKTDQRVIVAYTDKVRASLDKLGIKYRITSKKVWTEDDNHNHVRVTVRKIIIKKKQ